MIDPYKSMWKLLRSSIRKWVKEGWMGFSPIKCCWMPTWLKDHQYWTL